MASTAIKIDPKAKEILDQDSKKWCRSVANMASYYIRLGKYVQDNEPDIVRKAMETNDGRSKKRTRKTS